MFVADTNVLSELMKTQPAPAVSRWAAMHPANLVFTTSINLAEVLVGIAILPAGRRRNDLEVAAAKLFGGYFSGKIFSFDSAAANAFSRIVSLRRSLGRPIEATDAQIAAIALSNGAAIVTRNVSHFTDCGLTIVDPWQP